jgi:hypothetical protein
MKYILIIAIVLLLTLIFSIDGKGQDRQQLQMKLDSVTWSKQSGTVLHGTAMGGQPVTFLYSRSKKKHFTINAWYTIHSNQAIRRGKFVAACIRRNF